MIVDFRKQQREHPPIHIEGTAVEKVESSSAYTSQTNWNGPPTQTVWWRRCNRASSTSGARRNLACHPKPWQTFTDAQSRASCRAVSPPGTVTAPPTRKALQRVCTTHHRGKTTCPPGYLQQPMSQEGQKDYQGQQPPEPLTVHPAIIQKARSVQVHQSWDRETEKQLLSQFHQTAK